MGPKKFGFQNIFRSQKIFGSDKIWVPKSFASEKFWVPKLFGSRKSLGPENFWVLKNFGLKKFVSRKNLCPEKICVSKKLGPKKFWSLKNFGPKKNFQSYKFWVSKDYQVRFGWSGWYGSAGFKTGHLLDTFQKIFQTPSRYTPDTFKTPSGQLLDTTTVTLPKLYTCRPFL